MTTDTNAILAERGKTHGKFTVHAEITQTLKFEMFRRENWSRLTPDQKEALEMVAHKVGRILAGDPNVADHWDDIAGYAKLVANRLATDQANSEAIANAAHVLGGSH